MKKEEKQHINGTINALMNILIQKDSITSAAMYLNGDSEEQTATAVILGDARLLAGTIQHHLKQNEEFRRFIFATVGSYLSQEPEHEKEFFNGIIAVKSNLGVN